MVNEMNLKKEKYYVYRISYNLCDNGVLYGCSDYEKFVKSKSILDKANVREKFGKKDLEFSLYFIEEVDLEELKKFGLNLDSIPLVD